MAAKRAAFSNRTDDLAEHLARWETYLERRRIELALDEASGLWDEDALRERLAELPEVGPVDALAANAAAAEILNDRRWAAIKDARWRGETWEAIGRALGISKQGAQDYYRRRLAEDERIVDGLSEVAKALRGASPSNSEKRASTQLVATQSVDDFGPRE